MMEKVLVALDGSEIAEKALPYATELCRQFGSDLDLISVSPEKETGSGRLLSTYLGKLVEGIREEGIRTHPVLLYGSVAESIIDYADRNQISLIVMTTRGLSGLTRWVMGSTAEKLLRASRVPLLVIKAEPQEKAPQGKAIFQQILVPLDGSTVGETALPLARALTTKLGAGLSLLQVVPRAYEVAVAIDYVPGYPEQVISNLREGALAYLKTVKERLGKNGVDASMEVRIGNPSEEIINYAEETKADLIAMSTHGRSGISRWVLGSVTAKVVRAIKTPVLLVRAGGAKGAAA